MKKLISTFILMALLISPAIIEAEETNGHKLLFAGVKSTLSEKDQKNIFSQLEFTTTITGNKLLYDEEDAAPEVEVVDLNGDKIKEVFISYGTAMACGNAGRCLVLFVRDFKGKYIKNFDLPAIGYERLKRANMGFPDLAFAAPGFCRGVWRWSGVKYEHFRNIPEVKGGCDAIEKRQKKL